MSDMPDQFSKGFIYRKYEQRYEDRMNRLISLLRYRCTKLSYTEIAERDGVYGYHRRGPATFPEDVALPLSDPPQSLGGRVTVGSLDAAVADHLLLKADRLSVAERRHVERDWLDPDKGWWGPDRRWWTRARASDQAAIKARAGGAGPDPAHPDHPIEKIMKRGRQQALEISLGLPDERLLEQLDALFTGREGVLDSDTEAREAFTREPFAPLVDRVNAGPGSEQPRENYRDLKLDLYWVCAGAPGHFQVYVAWNPQQVTVVTVTPSVPHAYLPEQSKAAYEEATEETKRDVQIDRGLIVVRRLHDAQGYTVPNAEVIARPIPLGEGGAGAIRRSSTALEPDTGVLNDGAWTTP